MLALAMVGALALLALAPVVSGPAQAAPATSEDATRPSQNVAYARVAVVRILTSYLGATANAGLVPALSQCAGDGVIVGTTGNGLNSYSYVLLPTALVNPINPCQGVKTTFAQFNGNAQSWSLYKIQVMLDAAYTGVDSQRMGSATYTIDPSQIHTTGASSGPKLLALPLSIPKGSPAHDLPVLQTPQVSDAPPDPSLDRFIDLTGYDGQPLNRDSLLNADIPTTLYPVDLAASAVYTQPTSAPSATGTLSSSPAATAKPQPTATPILSSLASQLSLGSIEVDGNGRLIGMIGPDNQGNHVFYGVKTINSAIGSVTGKSGALMSQWAQGMSAFYANSPNYSAAHSAFAGLLSAYPDFAGAKPFADAASQQNTDIPALTATSPGGASTPLQPRTLLGQLTGGGLTVTFGAILIIVLVAIGAFIVLQRRRGLRPAFARVAPADEAMLDLLPPDMALDDIQEQPTLPIQSVNPRALAGSSGAASPPSGARASVGYAPRVSSYGQQSAVSGYGQPSGVSGYSQPSGGVFGASRPSSASRPMAIDEIATSQMAVAAAPRGVTRGPRVALALTPRSSGDTDPGVKRRNDPNQDNIFALEGIRQEAGRLQPFGLFIVADGMGGHLNGQLASRLAIETMARSIVRVFQSSQHLEPNAPRDMLVESVHAAHTAIQRRNHEMAGDMGSTVTAALVVDDRAFVINVGDSRTYLLSPDAGLRALTRDHSIVASLAESGVIKPEDIYIHPRRNQIYRSLGGDEERIEVDAFEQDLQAGDKLLLCSDGLWEMVRDPQIANILRGAVDPEQAVRLLVREANTNGGEDNIGVVVVRMIEGLPPDAAPGMRMVVGPADSGR
jgi:serine/threonine protein phosphatase PrpC